MADTSALKEQIQCIEAEELQYTFSHLSNDDAFRIGSQIRDRFLQHHDAATQGVVISITLFSGHILFQSAVGDSRKLGPDNWDWVRRKTNTVKRFGHSSFLVGRQRLLKGKDLDGLGPDYAAHGGAFPINFETNLTGPIGAIVVSGLSQEQDHKLIVDTLAKELRGY